MEIDVTYEFNEKPTKVLERIGRRTYMYLPYDINEDNGKYTCKFVRVQRMKYGDMVDAIIKTKYSDSKNFAIINNYLLDQTNPEYKSEYDDLQSWRRFAKDEARKYFNI